jgi:hypothetical protein
MAPRAVRTAGRLALVVLAGLAGVVASYLLAEATEPPDRPPVPVIDLDDLPPVTAPGGATPTTDGHLLPPPVLVPDTSPPAPAVTSPPPAPRPAPAPAPGPPPDDDDDDDGDDADDGDDGDDDGDDD